MKFDMPPELERVFEFFAERFSTPVAIIGSAVFDPGNANDIDVLLPHDIDWFEAMEVLGTRYNGWDTKAGHVRRANLPNGAIRDVGKRVQVVQTEAATPYAHPHAALLPDGTVIHPHQRFDKSKAEW